MVGDQRSFVGYLIAQRVITPEQLNEAKLRYDIIHRKNPATEVGILGILVSMGISAEEIIGSVRKYTDDDRFIRMVEEYCGLIPNSRLEKNEIKVRV